MSSSKNFDVVNICGVNEGGHCGYCNNTGSTKSSYGIICDRMKPETYLNMMNRGWRRCGTYYYKPFNDSTCCPLYPIRCNASDFTISKSQKKVLNRFKEFLMNGKKNVAQPVNASGDTGLPSNYSNIDNKNNDGNKVAASNNKESSVNKRDHSKKAKSIRYNLKLDKLRKLADLQKVPYDDLFKAYTDRRMKRISKNKPKPLSDYFDYSKMKSAKHRLTLKALRCHPESDKFKESLPIEHVVYKKYQCAVHHDKPEDVKMSQFKRFLVEGGLLDPRSPDNIDLEGRSGRLPQGQYHLQYWLDDKELLAVGVIDLLPSGISSVYLFYDPAFAFLDLGVYSALAEINFVNQLRCRFDQDDADFLYYYMGFYVHACPKMNYKARFSPSSIACPVTFAWVDVRICQQFLDREKFTRFASAVVKDDLSLEARSAEDLAAMVTVQVGGRASKLSKVAARLPPSLMTLVVDLARLLGGQALRAVQVSL